MTSELSHLIPAPTLHKITLPPDFWDLASGKRPDEKIVVELTPRAANWIKRFDLAEIKRHFNLKNTGHKNAAVEELAAACKKIAEDIDAIAGCKTPEEIRERFDIKNDFTREEEAEVRRQNEWCRKSGSDGRAVIYGVGDSSTDERADDGDGSADRGGGGVEAAGEGT